VSARKSKPPAARLFDEHPIRRGIEAGAFAYLQAAFRLAINSQDREHQSTKIQRMLRDGWELLGWVTPPLRRHARSQVDLRMIEKMISHTALPPEQKIQGIRLVTKRPLGRPAESKYLAVCALEAKVARPEATWEQITACVCPCTKPTHNSYCTDNLEKQVGRLKKVLHRTKVISFVFASAKNRTLKHNLLAVFG
jgi:hypothetical protein